MGYLLLTFITMNIIYTKCEYKYNSIKIDRQCNTTCPEGDDEMKCGFESEMKIYKMFSSQCAMNSYAHCYNYNFSETPLEFCIKNLAKPIRRVYGESCPAFCPAHYRPVCGASKIRSYKYRTFNNGCYLDMLNCRGDEDNGYVEVPLDFCQRHLMKNIFKEQVIVSRNEDYKEYQDY